MQVWFQAVNKEHRLTLRSYFHNGFKEILDKLAVEFDYGDREDTCYEAIIVNGDAVNVNLKFKLRNGEGFTHAAMKKFVELVRLISQEDYHKTYILPTPSIVQETMVEVYYEGNWESFGQYVWDTYYPRTARDLGYPI